MSETDKAIERWESLLDKMQGIIDAQRQRIDELTAELTAELEKQDPEGLKTRLRIAEIYMDNLQVTLRGKPR
jgi:mevalonate kinase